MSLVLVLPDLHQNLDAADAMLAGGLKHNPDLVVFLGDLFDSFHDSPERAKNAALWLQKRRAELGDRLVTLYGNHDVTYAEATLFHARHGVIPNEYRPKRDCSGFEVEKARAIIEAVGPEFWEHWKLHHREDGVLYTHAGANAAMEATLDEEATRAIAVIGNGTHPLLLAGAERGGACGQLPGVLWCDFSEFADDAPCPQIFGHSRKEGVVRLTQKSACLDTACASFALIRDASELRILSTFGETIKAVATPFDERYAATSRRHGNSRVRREGSAVKRVGSGTDFTITWPPPFNQSDQ